MNMDYEKAYNKALERAKSAIKDCGDNKGRISMIESIFPELKGSEDERIRKELLESFKYQQRESCTDKEWLNGIKLSEVVAWLEKQKSVRETVERCKNSWYNEGKIAGMADGLTNDEKYQQGWHDALEKQGEKPTWSEEDYSKVQRICEYLNEAKKYYADITEVRECMDWLKSLEDRVQPKQEWNENDEKIITALMEGFRYHQLFNPIFGEVPNAEIISWIKSLKERLI